MCMCVCVCGGGWGRIIYLIFNALSRGERSVERRPPLPPKLYPAKEKRERKEERRLQCVCSGGAHGVRSVGPLSVHGLSGARRHSPVALTQREGTHTGAAFKFTSLGHACLIR